MIRKYFLTRVQFLVRRNHRSAVAADSASSESGKLSYIRTIVGDLSRQMSAVVPVDRRNTYVVSVSAFSYNVIGYIEKLLSIGLEYILGPIRNASAGIRCKEEMLITLADGVFKVMMHEMHSRRIYCRPERHLRKILKDQLYFILQKPERWLTASHRTIVILSLLVTVK